MYFAIIANDNYPEETYTSDIYYRRPTLKQLYDKFGDPGDMVGCYYKWSIIIKKISNFRDIDHVAALEYSEDGYLADDYVIGGDGYICEEHKQRLADEND